MTLVMHGKYNDIAESIQNAYLNLRVLLMTLQC